MREILFVVCLLWARFDVLETSDDGIGGLHKQSADSILQTRGRTAQEKGAFVGEQKQQQRMKYYFDSEVVNEVNGMSQVRKEYKDSEDTVRGYYGYTDGYYSVKVHYIADAHGYRVISEERKPLPPLLRIPHRPVKQIDKLHSKRVPRHNITTVNA